VRLLTNTQVRRHWTSPEVVLVTTHGLRRRDNANQLRGAQRVHDAAAR
jgi:ribosomal 30S subunit maturation factor RimM